MTFGCRSLVSRRARMSARLRGAGCSRLPPAASATGLPLRLLLWSSRRLRCACGRGLLSGLRSSAFRLTRLRSCVALRPEPLRMMLVRLCRRGLVLWLRRYRLPLRGRWAHARRRWSCRRMRRPSLGRHTRPFGWRRWGRRSTPFGARRRRLRRGTLLPALLAFQSFLASLPALGCRRLHPGALRVMRSGRQLSRGEVVAAAGLLWRRWRGQ